MPMDNVAQAQTLKEYKMELAQRYPAYQAVLDREAAESSKDAGEIVQVKTDEKNLLSLDSNSKYKELRAEGQGWLAISARDKSTIQPMTIRSVYGPGPNGEDDAEGGTVNIAAGYVDWDNPSSFKDNDGSVTDMTNVQFKAEAGDIIFTNGVVLVKAENLYGGQGALPEGNEGNGKIRIGDVKDANVNTILKLIGNTEFNTGNWIGENGKNISGDNYIILTQKGTLEANSAQIFDRGLGAEGQTDDPKAVRHDANVAIKFEAGKLLLDDDKYNVVYLEKANTLIKAADNGTTEVVVKDTASKVDVARDITAVPDDSYAAGVTTTKQNIVIGNSGDSTVNKLNATYLNMASTTDGSANSITVKDGRNLYLGSNANNRELITVDNEKPAKNVDVKVQGGSKLTLGRFDVQNRLTGDVTLTDANSEMAVEAGQRKKLQEALPGAVLPNIVDKMTFSAAEKAKSPASEFIAQATNGLYSDSMSTALINVAAQPAETVGATAAAVEHSLDFAQQAQGHLSFFNGADVKSDQAWIKYGHRNGSVDSLDIGGMSTGYDSSFNGVTVGYDLPAVDSFHHGFAFSYGKGSNDGAWENDDFNTKGVSWYGSLNTGNNNMLFDVGYYHTEHDVNGIFHAKPKTDVFTMGITNEFRLPQGNDGHGAIVPHIGLRYSHVGTPRYSGYWKGSEAFRYHPEGKDLFSLPFGVGYIYESKSPEHTTSFYADLAYVPVFGGRSADMRVQACGIDAEDVFAYDASYGSAFVGSLGVKQESDSWEWGLSYRYSANSNQHSNDIMANIAFKF